MQIGPSHHPALIPVNAICQLSGQEELVQAVGHIDASLLQRKAALAVASLQAPIAIDDALGSLSFESPRWQAEPVCDLARHCISLAAAVECGFDDGTAGQDDLWDWDFGVTVAEAVANGLAAASGVLMPSSIGKRHQESAAQLLEELSRELDCIAAHVFGGLCRLDSLGWETEAEGRLHRALCGICVWALFVVGRCFGFAHFSSEVLWEFVSHDHSWAVALTKGVFLSTARDSLGTTMGTTASIVQLSPQEMQELRNAAFAALCGLASPRTAFASERELETTQDDNITLRNAWLSQHRLDLAGACVDCNALGVLIATCADVGAGYIPMFACFLAALLQPELVGLHSEGWCGTSSLGQETFKESCDASSILRSELHQHNDTLWNLLSTPSVMEGDLAMRGFLQDCSNIAYFVPPTDLRLSDHMLGCLFGGSTGLGSGALAALCAFAANAGLDPEKSVLVEVLASLEATERSHVASRWARWRGPIKDTGRAQWTAALGLTEQTNMINPIAAPLVPAEPHPLPEQHVERPAPLQHLLRSAPVEFRCQLDGQLMMDPVRTPSGYVFERVAIARALNSGSGHCPVSGTPLTLAECTRMPELRRSIAKWVRQQRPVPQ